MKKVLITSILILAIISSLLAGTVSYYTTSIDNLAGGSVTAKEFIFLGEGTQSFTHSEAIAPSESVAWSFKVRNYNDSAVTETNQYYKLNIDVTNAEGKKVIEPLKVTITDRSGNEHSVTGTGSFSILDDFPIQTAGQEHEYQVTMYWPSGDNDIDYAGNGFGNSVKVSAIASQIPFDSETKPVEPEEPGEPGEGEGETSPEIASDISVSYHTTTTWGTPSTYKYQIVLTNNSDEDLQNWEIKFRMPTARIHETHDNFRLNRDHEDEGTYTYLFPINNDDRHTIKKNGGTITIGGLAFGTGEESITDFFVMDKHVLVDFEPFSIS